MKRLFPLILLVFVALISLWRTFLPEETAQPNREALVPEGVARKPVPQLEALPEVVDGPDAQADVAPPVLEKAVVDPDRHFSPEMRSLVEGIRRGTPVQVRVGNTESTYVFRPKNITEDNFQISIGPDETMPVSFEVFEGRPIQWTGAPWEMAKMAVVNDTVSVAYSTSKGDFLIEENEKGELVSRTLLSLEEGSTWGHFKCVEENGRAGIQGLSGDSPEPPVKAAAIELLASEAQESKLPEREAAQADHPYFRRGAQYDASLKDISVLMISSKSRTGTNLTSKASTYLSYAATAADVYEYQLGLRYLLQELVLIPSIHTGDDIEPNPYAIGDGSGNDDINALKAWCEVHRPQGTYKWGHASGWTFVDGNRSGFVGWADVDGYGSSTRAYAVNEPEWTWKVHVHELGHNVGASHTSGGAMDPTVYKSRAQNDFFTENAGAGGYTAAKDIYNYMSSPSRNFVFGPADLRNPDEIPFGIDDLISTPADTPVVFDPTLNDLTSTPLFGSTNTITLLEVGQVFPKAGGTASISGNEITFTPASGFTGNVWFSYTILGDVGNGGKGWLHTADVVVTVGGNSSDPSQNPSIHLTDDIVSGSFSGPIRINPLLNDEGKGRLWSGDVDVLNFETTGNVTSDQAFFLVSATVLTGGGSIVLEKQEMTVGGSNTQQNTGYLTYTADINDPNQVLLEYTAEDANGIQSTATITINNTDTDRDGLPDEWELFYFGNLNQSGTDDTDNDTLTNLEEFSRGLNPTVDSLMQIFVENMDADPGWTTQGLWAFGSPTGQGGASGGPDPSSGVGGDPNVYGYNLQGDYENNLSEQALTTSPIDCSGFENVTLTFQRWLGVENNNWDNASVRVSNNGVDWTQVWANGSSSFSDSAWTEVSYDISSVAAGEANVQIRWVMGTTDGSVQYCGWNIDEVMLRGQPSLPSVTLAATDAEAAEEGQEPGVWTFTRTGDLSSPLTVLFTLGGSATVVDDYTVTQSTSVTIPATQASTTVTLTPVDDSVPTEIESAELTLSIDPAYIIGTSGPVAISILDNDNNAPVVDAGPGQIVGLTGEGLWTPALISPTVWFDASDATTITESGGSVSGWADKSGNGNHATQGTSANQPETGVQTLNGQELLTVRNGSKTMSVANTPTVQMGVAVVNIRTSHNTILNIGSTSSSTHEFFVRQGAPQVSFDGSGSTTGKVNVDGNPFSGFLEDHTVTSAGAHIWGGVFTSSNSLNTILNRDGLASDAIGHDVGEILWFSSELGLEDRQSLEGYLAHKWGLQAQLPGTHPYQASAPGASSAVVSLDGTVTDADGTTPTTTWTQVSGPGTVVFDEDSEVDTTATINLAGTYVLRLTADDGIDQTSSDVTITVYMDQDGDGMDDDWETTVLGSDSGDGSGDLDDNGITDYFQWIYGPTGGSYPGFSFVVAPTPSATGVTYTWTVQSDFELGTDFILEASTDLSDPNGWSTLVLDADDSLVPTVDPVNNKTTWNLELDDDLGSRTYLRLRNP